MTCWPQTKVSLPYVFYFSFFALGCLISFPIMDSIGRRTSNFIFTTTHLAAQFVITYCQNYTVRLWMFALMGTMQAKNSLCYTWLFEFVEQKHRSAASVSVNFLDLFACCIGGLYFLFITTEVQPLLEVYLYVGIGAYLILCFIIPESPKWFLMQG